MLCRKESKNTSHKINVCLRSAEPQIKNKDKDLINYFKKRDKLAVIKYVNQTTFLFSSNCFIFDFTARRQFNDLFNHHLSQCTFVASLGRKPTHTLEGGLPRRWKHLYKYSYFRFLDLYGFYVHFIYLPK